MVCKIILSLILLVSPSLAFYSFRQRIPNGEIVPHPCKANYMWGGVGHTSPEGGGNRNVFGQAFDRAGRKWTEELCRSDSDGDGKTNGEELGDPNCMWQEGQVAEKVTGITHPGICNPYGIGDCAGRDSFVDCSVEEFGESCDVIKNPDVQEVDLRYTKHTVPNTETNYYCQYFDLPSDQDYHIVANEALIDNQEVMHHMIAYACPDDHKSKPSDNEPNPCSMSGENDSCSVLISLWAVGLPGTCFGEDKGFRIGLNGYKKVKLEFHYNNPMLTSGMTDASGIRLFYQPYRPETQNLATFTVGQSHLEIPPGKDTVVAKGSCPSDCTSFIIKKPMYVFSTINHMHYLGRAQKTEIIRDGRVVKVLAEDNPYSYDSPVYYEQEPPFEVLPGDEIATTCTFSSLSRKKWTFYGDATSAEMCFAFLTVYPEDAIPDLKWCASQGPLSPCDLFSGTPRLGCDWRRFTNLSNPEMTKHYINLMENCNMNGICREECKDVVEEIKQHPCIASDMNSQISEWLSGYKEGAQFLARLHSCNGHDDHDDHDDQDSHDDDDHHKEVDCAKDCAHTCKHDNDWSVGDDDWQGQTDAAASLPVSLMVTFFLTMTATMATMY